MSYLIETKLVLPQECQGIIRDRLLHKMEDYPGNRLVLIKAAAGYGKTSLSCSYVQRSGLPCLWYQLDNEDAVLETFLGYLARGWQRLGGQDYSSLIKKEAVEVSPEEKINSFLGFLFKEIDNISKKFLIILDDYHLVQHSTLVNRLVQLLISYLPQGVRLIITSRTSLPFPLGTLRSRGWVTEIVGKELAFTLEEAEDFFQETSVSHKELVQFWEKVGGWAAGLSLVRYALLQEGTKEDIVSFITSYTREYLEQEVFNIIPPALQDFLEITSLLEYPDREACQALTGDGDAGKHLEELSRNQLFVKVSAGGIYHYHQMLREYLLSRLQKRLTCEEWFELHRLAGNIYYHRGMYSLAANHFYQANDLGSVRESLLQLAPELLGQGEHVRLKKWLDLLPGKLVHDTPRILYYRAGGSPTRKKFTVSS